MCVVYICVCKTKFRSIKKKLEFYHEKAKIIKTINLKKKQLKSLSEDKKTDLREM